MRQPLPSKIGKGRSSHLSPEILVNMFAEQAPAGAKSGMVARGTPGYTLFADLADGKLRGLYKTQSDGALYVVVDRTLYSVSSAGAATNLGTISGSGRVFFADSETELCIVAGSQSYTYNTTEGLELITSNGFAGASSVTYLDGYFIFTNRQNGQKDQFFISSLLDGETYDALDFATAERYPDNLVRVFADHSQLLLFGTDSIEIWFNADNADFPFARAQGSVIDQGLGAAHSVVKIDESVVWLDNEGMIRRLEGNTPVRISDHSIEYLISKGDWTNAYAWTYTMEGHQFYALTVPAANNTQRAGTYVWDAATRLWHQRKSYELDYSRIGFYAYAFGKHIVGDVLSGKLYELSLDTYQENGEHLIAELHFPQIQNDGNRFIVHRFQLDMEVGNAGLTSVNQIGFGDWSQETSGVASILNGVYSGDDYSIAVGASGVILKSTDSGESWTSKTSGFGSSAINDIGFGNNRLVAVGAGATRSVSTDEGETWSATSEVFGVTLVDGATTFTQENDPFGVAFGDSGTKMYIVGLTNDTVYQYTLSTAYDVSTRTYASKSFSVAAQTTAPYKARFKTDGTKMYIQSSNKRIYQYTLSTPWDVSTASYDSVNFSTAGQVSTNAFSLYIKPDGSGFYLSTYDGGNNSYVYQYSMSTPWDMSTASYASKSLTITRNTGSFGNEIDFRGLSFKPDGTRIFLADSNADIYELSLSTAWDVTTATYSAFFDSSGDGASSPRDIIWNDDGTKMYLMHSGVSDIVFEFSVAPAYDLSGNGTDFQSANYGNGYYIVTGTAGYIYRSSDTSSWSSSTSTFDGDDIFGAAYRSGRWVAVGANGKMARSDNDGLTWIAINNTSFGSSDIYDIGYGNGYLIAVGDAGKIGRSEYGINWQQMSSPFDTNEKINSVAFVSGLWFAVGESGEMGYSRDNGKTWTLITSSFSTTDINGVHLTGSLGLAVGDGGKIGKSVLTSEYVSSIVSDPKIMLRVSSDTKTTGLTQPTRSTGKIGEYSKRVMWRRLGQHRSFTPIVTISDPIKRAVFTSYVDIEPCGQ